MAMNVFTQSNLLVLLLLSSLPVMTSLPDFFGASPQTLNDLDSPEALESLEDLRHQYAAYLHDQPDQALAENALNEVDDDAESYHSPREVTKRTQRLRQVMGAIYRRIQTVEQQKQALRRLEMLYQSGKRGPTNHFLRIGKRSADNIEDMAVPETMSDSDTFRDRFLFNIIHEDFSPMKIHRNRDDEESDELPENVQPSFPTVFSKRGFLSKSRFLRIGKSSQSPVANDLSSILFRGLRGEDQREKYNMESSQQTAGPVVRRSYVRIGRLPASVFRQQPGTDSQQQGTESFLAGRRSPGYRLSKSGVVRAGKRTI